MKITRSQLRLIIETVLNEQEGPIVGSTVTGGPSYQFSGELSKPIKKGSPPDEVKRLQSLLLAKGFNPGPVDGDVGNKTITAINAFKKSIGKTPDGVISGDDLKTLQTYNAAPALKTQKDLTPKGGILYFGDSQMQGGVGATLEATLGKGKRLFKVGSTPTYWIKNPELIAELQKLPQKIVINLGGNGTQSADALISLIMRVTPQSPIVWFGGPPAIVKTSSPYEKLRSLSSVRRFNISRKSNNDFIADLTSRYDNIQFIDPFDFFNPSDIESGKAYTCTKCDGVHMPKEIAQQYYASQIPRDTVDTVADIEP